MQAQVVGFGVEQESYLLAEFFLQMACHLAHMMLIMSFLDVQILQQLMC